MVLEVIGREPASGGLRIASAWGRRAEWFRNLEVDPSVEVYVGRRRFTGTVTVLAEPEAQDAFRDYASAHPLAYRTFIGPLLLGRRPTGATDELTELARVVPILVVRPARGSGDAATRDAPA